MCSAGAGYAVKDVRRSYLFEEEGRDLLHCQRVLQHIDHVLRCRFDFRMNGLRSRLPPALDSPYVQALDRLLCGQHRCGLGHRNLRRKELSVYYLVCANEIRKMTAWCASSVFPSALVLMSGARPHKTVAGS